MVTANGLIYKFQEGQDDQQVDFEVFQTGLKKAHDVEGLCHDPETNSLLLALKGEAGKGLGKNKKAIYSFSLATNRLSDTPRFVLDGSDLSRSEIASNGN